jgi:ATP-binding cassette subfamily C protein
MINIVIGVIGIVIPMISGKFIDNVVYAKNINFLYNYIIVFMILNLFNISISYLSSHLRVIVGSKSAYSLCSYILKHLHKISLLDLENENSSYLSQRIKNDSNDIIYFCLNIIANTILNLVGLIIAMILIININYIISLVVALIAILYVVGYKLFKNSLYKVAEQVREQQSRYFSNINNQITRAKFIKLHAIENIFILSLNKSFLLLFEKLIKNQKLSNLYNSYNITLSVILKLILCIVGGINIINGNMTIGIFFVLSSYLDKAMGSLIFFASFGENYQVNLASYNRIKEILDKPCVNNEGEVISEINNISLENIYFKYNEKLILDNFSQEFSKGNIYWIKGNNGAGKSTLVSLIINLYEDNYEGKISYNGKDVKSLDMNKTRKNLIGIVEQNPILIEDTIFNNITFFEDYDESILREFTDLVGLRDFLYSKRCKLNNVINENSANISGGEKQKLSILREIIKNPSLLIMDEPTSAMDKNSRAKFYDYIHELKKEKIIIIISHDKIMSEIADHIIDLSVTPNVSLVQT